MSARITTEANAPRINKYMTVDELKQELRVRECIGIVVPLCTDTSEKENLINRLVLNSIAMSMVPEYSVVEKLKICLSTELKENTLTITSTQAVIPHGQYGQELTPPNSRGSSSNDGSENRITPKERENLSNDVRREESHTAVHSNDVRSTAMVQYSRETTGGKKRARSVDSRDQRGDSINSLEEEYNSQKYYRPPLPKPTTTRVAITQPPPAVIQALSPASESYERSVVEYIELLASALTCRVLPSLGSQRQQQLQYPTLPPIPDDILLIAREYAMPLAHVQAIRDYEAGGRNVERDQRSICKQPFFCDDEFRNINTLGHAGRKESDFPCNIVKPLYFHGFQGGLSAMKDREHEFHSYLVVIETPFIIIDSSFDNVEDANLRVSYLFYHSAFCRASRDDLSNDPFTSGFISTKSAHLALATPRHSTLSNIIPGFSVATEQKMDCIAILRGDDC